MTAEVGARLPVSVIVPTIGRIELLRQCVRSLLACSPLPDEIVLVDQSGGDEVSAAFARPAEIPVRVVPCEGRGIALGTNLGMGSARNDVVLVTNDDCTVATDWVDVAWRRMRARPDGIVTGRVLPPVPSANVPSLKRNPNVRDYTGTLNYGVLFGANMAVDRRLVTALGGFDERDGFRVAAEDVDFCYRWLTAGRPLLYEPAMVIWHHDWRTPEQLAARYRSYARGRGVFYAKHLHAGDRRMLGYIAKDLGRGVRSVAVAVLKRRPRWQDERRELLRDLPGGMLAGWREARRLGPSRDQPAEE